MTRRQLAGAAALGAAGATALMLFMGTVWTTPISWPYGMQVTEGILNQQVRDNLLHLKESLAGLGGNFTNLRLSTHPDADLAATTVQLRHADNIVMNDGVGVADWNLITANVTLSGAGGLSTGAEGASLWYGIYAIRKSTDGTRNLLLHLDPQWRPNAGNLTSNGAQNFRETSSLQKVAQGIKFVTDLGLTAVVRDVLVQMDKVGTPTGYCWLTIETDNAGDPSGVSVADSQKIDVSLLSTSNQDVVFVFRNASPFTFVASTQYHIVWNSTVTVNASNYLQVRRQNTSVYADGALKTYNGSVWAAVVADAHFATVVQVDFAGPVSAHLPTGYDEYTRIGWVYNNASSNFDGFTALDRRVVPLSTQTLVSPLSSTVPSSYLVTLGGVPVLPPRPTTSNWWLFLASITGGAQRNLAINSGEGGYASAFTIRTNGQLIYSGTTVSGAEVGPVLNDSGYLMAKISGDTGGVFLGSWEWQ